MRPPLPSVRISGKPEMASGSSTPSRTTRKSTAPLGDQHVVIGKERDGPWMREPLGHDADADPVLLGRINHPRTLTQRRYRYADGRLLGVAECDHDEQQRRSPPNGMSNSHANLPRAPNFNSTGLRPEPTRALGGTPEPYSGPASRGPRILAILDPRPRLEPVGSDAGTAQTGSESPPSTLCD